jgi:hypothetical protein
MPTDHTKVIAKTNVSTVAFGQESVLPSHVGRRWIHSTIFDPKRLEEAKDKEEAHKNNRRKWGDSPSAN